jgi:hypothetical protein
MKNAIGSMVVVVLAGCGPSPSASGDPGFETGPCVDYQCLGGELVCLSNLCVDPNNMTGPDSASDTDSDDGQTSDPDTGDEPTERTREVDILFVMDNSGSMGEEQGILAANLPALLDVLDDAEVDWRIGVTTTDNGNPWCDDFTSPESGQLVLSSCRSRTGEFVFNGNPPADATAAACTSVCSTDTVSTGDNKPWIASSGDGTNLSQDLDTTEALQCTLPQGIAGCGFESHLESAYRALQRSANEDEEQYGFARSTAMLAIVFVTDEVDCSHNDESIFLPEADGGNPSAFWSDPEASAPTSAVCWNAGVSCEGSGTPYDSCQAANKDVTGAVGVSDDDAVLHPVARYVDYFQELEDLRKQTLVNGDVFVALIAGVPPNYDGDLVYSDSLDPIEQDAFGIGPGCTFDDGDPMTPLAAARPPVREREVAEAFMLDEQQNLFSICQNSYTGPLAAIADQITSNLGPAE